MLVTFELTVTPAFWEQPRPWPAACHPIVYSLGLVLHQRGTVQVPPSCARSIERRLRNHPAVIAVHRVAPAGHDAPRVPVRRAA